MQIPSKCGVVEDAAWGAATAIAVAVCVLVAPFAVAAIAFGKLVELE